MNDHNEPANIQSEHDPGPQKHAGRRILTSTNRNTQNCPFIMRQGLTIHRKAPSTAIAHLFIFQAGIRVCYAPWALLRGDTGGLESRDIAKPANELKKAGGCQGGGLGTCHWGLVLVILEKWKTPPDYAKCTLQHKCRPLQSNNSLSAKQ